MSKLTAANNQPFMLSERSTAALADPELGATGHVAINVEVQGYWSDVITAYARRDWRFDRTAADTDGVKHEWKFELSHSSGGRDTGEVADDAEAETNFAHALIWTADLLRSLRGRVADMDAAIARRDAARRAEEAAAKAAKQAAIDADPALGERAARALMALAGATRESRQREWDRSLDVQVDVFERGAETCSVMEFSLSRNCAVLISFLGHRITRADALQRLAASSARTRLAPAPVV